MVDYVGLLKRTIDAQSSATPMLRRRIYDRTRETMERQLASKPMPPEVAALQRRMLEKAIDEVENFYLEGGGRDSVSPQAVNAGTGRPQAAPSASVSSAGRGNDVFNALRKNAGINPAAAQPQPGRRPAASGGYMAEINPYGAADDDADEELTMPHPAAYARGGSRGAASSSVSAYGETASDADMRRGGSAQPRAGAYSARPSSAMNESAYGGGNVKTPGNSYGRGGSPSAANLSPYGGEAPIRGIFPLDDEEDDAGFSPYGGEPPRPAPASRASYPNSGRRRGLHPYGGEEKGREHGAFARGAVNPPVPSLPDYGADYSRERPNEARFTPYGEPVPAGRDERESPHFLNSYSEEDERPAERGQPQQTYSEPAVGDYNAGYGQLSGAAQPQSRQEPQADIPPSPYNIGSEDFSADYQNEAQLDDEAEPQANEAASQPFFENDVPPLHDFLFGSRDENEPESNAAPEPEAQEQQGYNEGNFSASSVSAEMEPDQAPSAQKRGRRSSVSQSAEMPNFTAPELDSFLEPDNEDREAFAAGDDYSPLPDFLRDEPAESNSDDKPANASQMTEDEQIAFNLQQALAGHEDSQIAKRLAQKKAAQDKQKNKAAETNPEDLAPLPDDFLIPENIPSVGARAEDGQLPGAQDKGKSDAGGKSADAGNLSLSADGAASIFAQSALREKKRSGKKRLITGGAIILAVLVILGGIVWFLKDYAKSDGHKSAPVTAAATAAPAQKTNADKVSQRLTADGQEVNAAPAKPQEAAPQTAADNSASVSQAIKEASLTSKGDVLFRESKTALMPATQANGAVNWSVLHEKTDSGTDTILRANLSVPERDMVMRMTIRPNHDKTIPAVYLAELMFIVPENFEGQAVDKISPIMFKPTQTSSPQELMDAHIYKINDNFFVMTMNSPVQGGGINPKLQRNIALMEQLPWLTMNVAYKNGRIAEFNFSKGDNGDAVFKQFFDAQSPVDQGLPAPANSNSAPSLSTQPAK